MKKLFQLLFILLICFFTLGFFGGGNTKKIITVSNYKTKVSIYKAKGQEKSVGIVLLHGKNANPHVPHIIRLTTKLKKEGYKIVVPTMPWSRNRFRGSRAQAMEVIDESIKILNKKKVVVIGHSLGATIALHYAKKNTNLAGIVPVALGHHELVSTNA